MKMFLVTLADDCDMTPLSNKPNPGHNAGFTKWQKIAAGIKADSEKAEQLVLDRFGNTGELKINSETHSKIVLSHETIKQLIDYPRKDEWSLIDDSFDSIIKGLLDFGQKRNRRD